MKKSSRINSKRLYEENVNSQKCLMKIIEYNNYDSITVEFEDEYKAKVHTTYGHFLKGCVKNPYCPTIYNVGIVGSKYPINVDCKPTKEYTAWNGMLRRCYDEELKSRNPTYKDVYCCKEWLLFENFYDWLHSQENFDKWLNGDKWGWAVDKDILIKGNKIYSPDTCCLVPNNINQLFKKKYVEVNDSFIHVNLQISLSRVGNEFKIKYQNPLTNEIEYFTSYDEIEKALKTYKEKAFQEYKSYKENSIKKAAQEEYCNGNIIKKCYEAMMNYEVEIND